MHPYKPNLQAGEKVCLPASSVQSFFTLQQQLNLPLKKQKKLGWNPRLRLAAQLGEAGGSVSEKPRMRHRPCPRVRQKIEGESGNRDQEGWRIWFFGHV